MKIVILHDFEYLYESKMLFRTLSLLFLPRAQNKKLPYSILLEDVISKVLRLRSSYMYIYRRMISSTCGILYATYLTQNMLNRYKTTSETFIIHQRLYICIGAVSE